MLSQINIDKYSKIREAILNIHCFRHCIAWKEIAQGTPCYNPNHFIDINDRVAFEEKLCAVRIVLVNNRSQEYVDLMEAMLDSIGRKQTPNNCKQFIKFNRVCIYVARVLNGWDNYDQLEQMLKMLAKY